MTSEFILEARVFIAFKIVALAEWLLKKSMLFDGAVFRQSIVCKEGYEHLKKSRLCSRCYHNSEASMASRTL